MQLVNPLHYPIAIFAGGIALVLGVRVARLPSVVMLPVAAGIAISSATWIKSREPETFNLDNPELEAQLQAVHMSAKRLADKAKVLRLESTKLLTDSFHLELLATIQYACDRAAELPTKIDSLAKRFQGSNSLLSVNELQQQLTQVQNRLEISTGSVAQEHLTQLAQSLQHNIGLVQQGQDARQAQVTSLSTLIQDTAGVLQALQNKLRTADLTDSAQIIQLRSLSEQLGSYQENVGLISK